MTIDECKLVVEYRTGKPFLAQGLSEKEAQKAYTKLLGQLGSAESIKRAYIERANGSKIKLKG